jgi:hypothetical protein
MEKVIMANNDGDSGGTTVLALVLGAMMVLVVGLYAGGVFAPHKTDTASITIETPKAPAPAPTPDQ